MTTLTETAITELVLACLREELQRRHPDQLVAVNTDTPLVGPGAVLDSLGLVTFAVSLEQRLSDAAGTALNVADEQELTRRNSPFQTVGTLVPHLAELVRAGEPL